MKRKKILIIATGGTIAGLSQNEVSAGYQSGSATVSQLLSAVPQLLDIADIEADQFSNIGSQNMTFTLLQALAKRVTEAANRRDIDGIVITHGTDTMEETAFFLNLTVNTTTPIVLTGAMRPATVLSPDGPLNLFNAVAVATHKESIGNGVMVVMNNKILDAHSLAKTNTTAVETFLAPIRGFIGSVNYGKAKFYRTPYRKHTNNSKFHSALKCELPRVDIHYGTDDMPLDLLEASVSLGAKGIIIAAVGNGNMSDSVHSILESFSRQGIIIVRSTRVAAGTVGRNIEIDDDASRFIVSDELSPSKARILLMLALACETKQDKIQDLYMKY